MADISLADIKALRDRLGTGMVDTKNALVEAEGDIEKAVEILRLKGAKGNAKRADRSTSEGLIAAVESATATTMIELACETDFVAKNEKFVALGEKVLAALADSGAETLDAALAVPLDGGTVGSVIDDQAATIGEKVELRRVVRIPGEKFAVYLHRTSKDLPPQIGVVVSYTGDDAETARSIAQHISFADPQYLSRDDVPPAEVENERRIVEEISRGEGKPEAALPKIVEGRIGAFFKQVSLLEQDYAKDNKLSVKKVLEDSGLTVTGFARFKVGA
ncbi:elongation factor Ts [Microbacteriaceae bacterium SG_E_30_P1]|uniref:Elongation factor Ts n=1 Tax=Antiquaquibacter oligotrophicus TaxID=2880260 RepID=A0ABT6KQC9_9MICO|nr:translation elongation factor Ts [Antiquaquibacter oligotrophicus]MDH6181404.1 elongation factor Ts [Antiquaquibacter oligotrophicus]UDF12904.1 translation elongation factor Ts [Antiquaquibacter oligotrophicus]